METDERSANLSCHRTGEQAAEDRNLSEGGSADWRGGGKRYFGRGGVKYALLRLLESQPMHGYQMMKSLEEQSGGLYIPSAGSIYPTLQMLEDRELISSTVTEGKKIYRIRDAGRAFLKEGCSRHREPDEPGGGRGREGWDGCSGNRRPDGEPGLLRLLMKAERRVLRHPEYQARFRHIVDHASRELLGLLNDMKEKYRKDDADDRPGGVYTNISNQDSEGR